SSLGSAPTSGGVRARGLADSLRRMSRCVPLFAAMMVVFGSFGTFGCAVASEEIDVSDGGKHKDTGGTVLEETGDEDAGGADSSTTDSGSTTTDSTATESGGDDSSTDTGSAAETGKPCTVLGPGDCSSGATNLGSVSGDTGSDTKTATG